jgi:cytoskeleton protein RodZ
MNKQYQEDTDSSQTTGLGQALRQGRESKSFSVSRVADGLHLRPSIVTAIEDENYELLPGDLFLKGYIRSYSRLVGLDEDKMINLLDQRLSDQANEKAVHKQALGKAKRKRHSKHAMLFLVIAGIVGVAFYMWSQRLGDANLGALDAATESVTSSPLLDTESTGIKKTEAQEVIESVELTEETEITVDEVSVVNEPVHKLESEFTIENPVSISVSTVSDMEEKPVIVREPELELESVVEFKTEVEPKLDVQQEPDLALKPVVDTEVLSTDKILDIGVISVIFSGDCWFTLKNGEGKTVYADLKRAGDEINYSGPVPFTLVIGAVSEVSVLFDQEPVDFSTVRVRNNRAELKLTH